MGRIGKAAEVAAIIGFALIMLVFVVDIQARMKVNAEVVEALRREDMFEQSWCYLIPAGQPGAGKETQVTVRGDTEAEFDANYAIMINKRPPNCP